jgi:hypothetical protein
MTRRILPVALFLLMAAALPARAQPEGDIDPEALIERILAVERQQREQIQDVTFTAEYIEGEEKDGRFKEKLRIVKRIYIKYLPDTAWYHEDFIEYYKDGELKSEKDRDKEEKKRREDKIKRKSRDISYPMLRPFYPERRELYDIVYRGIADTKIESYICHHFQVMAREETDTLLNGHYYFEAESFHLVRVDFSPAKLVKKAFFRLSELDMSITFKPTDDGYWFPARFTASGRGKAVFLFGVRFSGTEYYHDPVINSGLEDELFLETDDGN